MNVTYSGKHEGFARKQQAKLEAKLQKLSKLLERKGEKEAHVILTQERFLHKVEITIRAMDHDIVGVGSDGDLAVASNDALDRLEKQILKLRNKWRDVKRKKDKGAEIAAAPERAAARPTSKRAAAAPVQRSKSGSKKIFRVNHSDGAKPMTLEEALLEMEAEQDYLVYRDAKTDRVHVIMRRADGHFDLIES
jgi:putative sigma-54 modulation protein